MSEYLTNEMQWDEMSPRVIQMNGPLLSVNVCHDALTHSNSRCTDHSLL